MSNNQVQIGSMVEKLRQWNKLLGGNQAKKLTGTEFDFLQEEFLITRHQVEKAQDIKQKQGINTANAGLGFQIREGLQKMKQLAGKLRQEHRRLTKNKKDPPEVLERKLKIVQNCQLLLKDLQERETEGMPTNKYKAVTLTDMKAKLLKEIDENNSKIHEKVSSEGLISDTLEQDKEQIIKWKQKDQDMDVIVDEIITGVKNVKAKVKNINEAQEIINEKTGKAGTKIEVLATRIKGDNDKLKKIIQDLKPNSCCLYVVLFLLLVGLVVCIIKLVV